MHVEGPKRIMRYWVDELTILEDAYDRLSYV